MNPPEEPETTGLPADLSGEVTGDGVFQVVLDGYDAVYDALPRGETFNRIWRDNAYGGDFPAEFAHIGFVTVTEARQMLGLLGVRGGDVLADLACGAGGPGLWAAQQSGASLIGIDPSPAGLAAARERARRVRLTERSRFTEGTFERTGLADCAADAVMSVDAFQYAPDKQAAMAEFFRILRPGGKLALIAFEVDPAKVEGVPVLGVDPVPDYVPLLEMAGFMIDAYQETAGWRGRVDAAFGAIIEANDALVAEMGERAAASAVAEAMLTVQMKPYPRRILAVARRPA
ncbi:MAG: class I SAM-dependent methyltransferase [Streptosporangiaceae bacterium]